MRVVLVNPPASLRETWGELARAGNEQQPLGLAYIAAVLEKAGHNVSIVDAVPYNFTCDDVAEYVRSCNPDVVGITSVTLTFPAAVEVAERIRDVCASVIVIGGAHVTALPHEVMRHKCFDVGVIGEGEITMLELLAALPFSKLENVPGLALRYGSRIVLTASRDFIANLDILPLPARNLLPPLNAYHATPARYKKLPLGTVMTSRGCPYQCTYCARAVFGRKFRALSAARVVDDMSDLIYCHGAKEIRFQDDTCNANPRRMLEICGEIKNRNLNAPWTCIARINAMTQEVLEAMRDAGCWQVSYGIESGNQELLNSLKRHSRLEQVTDVVNMTKSAGIDISACFMLGLPNETPEMIEETISFAKSLNLDVVHFSIFTPFPGCELFAQLSTEGKLEPISYNRYTPFFPSQVAYRNGVDTSVLLDYQRKAYKAFYLRWSYIWKQLCRVRSARDVFKYMKAFFTIRSLH